jgi:hypothetical protein
MECTRGVSAERSDLERSVNGVFCTQNTQLARSGFERRMGEAWEERPAGGIRSDMRAVIAFRLSPYDILRKINATSPLQLLQ